VDEETQEMPHLIRLDDETYIGSPTNEEEAKERIDALQISGPQRIRVLEEKNI
jgi:hypothetical protein